MPKCPCSIGTVWYQTRRSTRSSQGIFLLLTTSISCEVPCLEPSSLAATTPCHRQSMPKWFGRPCLATPTFLNQGIWLLVEEPHKPNGPLSLSGFPTSQLPNICNLPGESWRRGAGHHHPMQTEVLSLGEVGVGCWSCREIGIAHSCLVSLPGLSAMNIIGI